MKKTKKKRPTSLVCKCGERYPVSARGKIPDLCHACRKRRNDNPAVRAEARIDALKKAKRRVVRCSCCGVNPVHKGFRFLCYTCWKANDGDDENAGVVSAYGTTAYGVPKIGGAHQGKQ